MRVKATVSAHALIVDQTPGDEENNIRVLMARLAYKDHRSNKWSFPGGFVDGGESIEAALLREVGEEIGLRLTHWQQMAVVPMLEQEQPHIGFVYLCDAWEGQANCLSREINEVAWIDHSTFTQIVADNELAYPVMLQQVACLGWDVTLHNNLAT